MSELAGILEREFANAREKAAGEGLEIEKGLVAEAAFLKISNPHLSRLRNGKVPLTKEVAVKIGEAFRPYTDEEKLKAELDLLVQGHHLVKTTSDKPASSDEFTISKAEELFDKLSQPDSLLCVDYRDFPQATMSGRYPKLAEKAGDAIKSGLCYAMFQPFGSEEKIRAAVARISTQIDHPKATVALQSYLYLLQLAQRVREVYLKMKKAAHGGTGQVVLYEAQIETPVITAIGLQSRLFLAHYFEGNRFNRKIFEWVTAVNDEDFFIERSEQALSLDALRLQFYPIHRYWEDNGRNRLPVGDELEQAYKDYKLEELLGGIVKWKDWTEPGV